MKSYLLVGLGSALGGAARWLTVWAGLALVGPAFPVGTLAVNVVGSFLIGLLAGVTQARAERPLSPELRAAIGVGFCGGFTTYSFFSWQVMMLSGLGSPWLAAAYVGVSVAASLAAVAIGFAGGRRTVAGGGSP